MLPAHALRPLLQYFDGVDQIVSSGLYARRPHLEVTLTSILCDLMDDDEQRKYRLPRDISWLQTKLESRIAATEIAVRFDTYEYPQNLERWVTQSDIGLVIDFEDFIAKDRDWVAASLLQAKRLVRPGGRDFTTTSTYGADDKTQRARIQALNDLFGYDLVRNLLYTPRPDALPPRVASNLCHRRDLNIAGPIFDYSAGLVVHRELTRKRRLIDGGILVAPTKPRPTRIDRSYDQLFAASVPWSWFLGLTLIGWPPPSHTDGIADSLPRRTTWDEMEAMPISPVALAMGDHEAAAAVAQELHNKDLEPFHVLPSRGLHVHVKVGGEGDLVDQ